MGRSYAQAIYIGFEPLKLANF